MPAKSKKPAKPYPGLLPTVAKYHKDQIVETEAGLARITKVEWIKPGERQSECFDRHNRPIGFWWYSFVVLRGNDIGGQTGDHWADHEELISPAESWLNKREKMLLSHALEAASVEFMYSEVQKEYSITDQEYKNLARNLGIKCRNL